MNIDILRDDPLLAAVIMDSVHLVHLKRSRMGRKLACLTCRYGTSDCDYVDVFRTWCQQTEMTIEESETQEPPTSKFHYISYRTIPYPMSDDMKTTYNQQETGQLLFPSYLVPAIPPNHTCQHGHCWNTDDPVEKQWFLGDAVIYKEGSTVSEVLCNGEMKKIKGIHNKLIYIISSAVKYTELIKVDYCSSVSETTRLSQIALKFDIQVHMFELC